MGKLQRESYNGKFRREDLKGTSAMVNSVGKVQSDNAKRRKPMRKFQRKTSNGMSPTGSFYRGNSKGKRPMGNKGKFRKEISKRKTAKGKLKRETPCLTDCSTQRGVISPSPLSKNSKRLSKSWYSSLSQRICLLPETWLSHRARRLQLTHPKFQHGRVHQL